MTWFAGTGQLVRLALRRDRLRIPLWVVGIGLLTWITAVSEENLYDTQEAIDGYAALVGESPVTVAFGGPPLGLDTIAGIIVYEASLTIILGISIMAVMMMARHTRAGEESGRSEMIRATEVGRHAAAAAALITTATSCLLVGAGVWLALVPSALTFESALVYGVGMAALGLVYAGLALCLAQLFEHARAVTGAGLALFAIGYVIRAAGDVRGDWLVWLSPIGWVQASHVPTENRWWPLVVPVVATALLLALAVVLAEHRDYRGGLLPTLPGRPTAPRSLNGPVGLAWRTQRSALVSWCVALLLLAALTGTLAQSMQDMVKDNPAMADYLAIVEGVPVIDSYLATMMLIFALTAGGFAVWSARHEGADEDEGQLDLVLAGPVSRPRARLGDLAVTVLNTTLVLGSAALGLGLAQGWVTGSVSQGWRAGAGIFTYLPAVLVLVGLEFLVVGWRRAWTWVGWLALAFVFVIGWLGNLIDPPRWVSDLSPFTHTPRVPVESPWEVELVLLMLVAAALVAVGTVGFRRRDVG